jgi:hypothetical protein
VQRQSRVLRHVRHRPSAFSLIQEQGLSSLVQPQMVSVATSSRLLTSQSG